MDSPNNYLLSGSDCGVGSAPLVFIYSRPATPFMLAHRPVWSAEAREIDGTAKTVPYCLTGRKSEEGRGRAMTHDGAATAAPSLN